VATHVPPAGGRSTDGTSSRQSRAGAASCRGDNRPCLRNEAFAESYLEALDAAGRADLARPRNVWGTFDETLHLRRQRAGDLAVWHEMLLEWFAGTPKTACWTGSPRARRWPGQTCRSCGRRSRGAGADIPRAVVLVTDCLKELPGHQGYQDFAVETEATLPPRAREMVAERARLRNAVP
jgi:hypothetical protein